MSGSGLQLAGCRRICGWAAAFADLGFAADDTAVSEHGFEGDIGGGGGEDASANGEDLRRQFDGLGKVAGDLVHGGEEKITEAMAFEAATGSEAVAKQLGKKSSSSDRAVMQLRMSPGGRMSKSRRRRPELPPSSETVTMAVISMMGIAASGWRGPPEANCLMPDRSVESPVPPPIETIRRGAFNLLCCWCDTRVRLDMAPSRSCTPPRSAASPGRQR